MAGNHERHARLLARAAEVVRLEAQTISGLETRLDARFVDAVDRLLACEGLVVVTGVGKAGLVGQKISATLSSTGTPSLFLHPTEAQHGDLGRIRARDLPDAAPAGSVGAGPVGDPRPEQAVIGRGAIAAMSDEEIARLLDDRMGPP